MVESFLHSGLQFVHSLGPHAFCAVVRPHLDKLPQGLWGPWTIFIGLQLLQLHRPTDNMQPGRDEDKMI